MGMGSVNVVSLAEARQKAVDSRKLVMAGIDPIEHRAHQEGVAALEAAKAITFKEAASALIENMRPGWKNEKHAAHYRAYVTGEVAGCLGVNRDALMMAVRIAMDQRTPPAHA